MFGFGRKRDQEPPTEKKSWLSGFFSWSGDRSDPQWFQKGGTMLAPRDAKAHAAAFSCANILAQEVAKLRIEHYRLKDDGSREARTGSHISRLLRRPNHYQTRSDFFLFMMENLLFNGNAYAYAERDQNGRVIKLHPRVATEVMPWVSPETGDIFYSLVKTDLDEAMVMRAPEKYLVPQRDILHLKLTTPRHPLIGESLLTGLTYAIPQGVNIQRDSTSFFGKMSRPSGVLSSPNRIGEAAMKRLRKAFAEGNAGDNAGRVAVLDNAFTFTPMTMSAADSQLIEQYKMTVADIAMVFRVPLYMLGDLTKTTYTNVEQMQKGFQAGALGFYTEHIEAGLNDFFGLNVTGKEYVEFDLERGVIRSELKTRMDAYAKAIQGGVSTINEARRKENLPPVKGGDEVYLQRQNWPLNLLGADAIKEAMSAVDSESFSSATDAEKAIAFREKMLSRLQTIEAEHASRNS